MQTNSFFPGYLFSFFLPLTVTFGITLLASVLLGWLAPFLRLEDLPDERKHHTGKIPMVGGLAVFMGIFVGCLLAPSLLGEIKTPFLFAFLILLLGVLDDTLNIRPDLRLLIQMLLILSFLYVGGLRLYSFGDLFFRGNFVFYTMSGLVTLLAFCAGINAFNMIDGMDGLAALMAFVPLVALACLFYPVFPAYSFFCFLLCASLFAFFLMNLHFFPSVKKIFLGDAGSMFLGFILSFLLIRASQGHAPGDGVVIRPITCVWLIALPLMDMVSIMLRRLLKGRSPLCGDRNHLHHLLTDLGLSSWKVLGTMGLLSIFFAGLGIAGELCKIHEGRMFLLYLFFFGFYFFGVARLSKRVAGQRDTV